MSACFRTIRTHIQRIDLLKNSSESQECEHILYHPHYEFSSHRRTSVSLKNR